MSSVFTPKFPYHHFASLILVGYEDSTVTRALGLDRDQQNIMSRKFHKIHKRWEVYHMKCINQNPLFQTRVVYQSQTQRHKSYEGPSQDLWNTEISSSDGPRLLLAPFLLTRSGIILISITTWGLTLIFPHHQVNSILQPNIWYILETALECIRWN